MRWLAWFRRRARNVAQRESPLSVRGAQLVDESEAFLTGHLVERLVSHDETVPPWAWMNLLAHGTQAELAAASRSREPHPLITWRSVRSRLATEVLDIAPCRGGLAQLQRDLLIPLELELASRDSRSWTPWHLVSRVELAIGARSH